MRIIGKSVVHISGTDSYLAYRIPTLIKAANGDILAFCEGRKTGFSDTGYIDILVKRSKDNGISWGEYSVVIGDMENTFGNFCGVTDKNTGRIHGVCNFNKSNHDEKMIKDGRGQRKGYYLYSDDNGYSWSKPTDITKMVKNDNWGWLAFGPCHGELLDNGRIIFPANHSIVGDELHYYSYSFYSDDNCNTFNKSDAIHINTNECSIANIDNGLYMNMRSYAGMGCRAAAYSFDNGESWQDYRLDNVLVDPVCQGSCLGLSNNVVVFSNAASLKRKNLTIRMSKDGGNTWSDNLILHNGYSAYSDIVRIDNNTIGCIYENGLMHPYEKITFAVIKLI